MNVLRDDEFKIKLYKYKLSKKEIINSTGLKGKTISLFEKNYIFFTDGTFLHIKVDFNEEIFFRATNLYSSNEGEEIIDLIRKNKITGFEEFWNEE